MTYEAGYAAIPDDLQEIAIELVINRFKSKGRDPMLMQRDQPELGSERWWIGPAPGQEGAFPPKIAAVIDRYRLFD